MNNKAFTLLELILFLVIFSILLYIISPNLNKLQDVKAKNEIKEMIRKIEVYKVKAMVKKESYSFNITYNGYYFTPERRFDSKEILDRTFFNSNIRISSNNFNNKMIITASGKPEKGGSFMIDYIDKKIRITILPVTGSVNVYYE